MIAPGRAAIASATRTADGWVWLALAVTVAVSAGLRLPTLGAQSLWLDEALSWAQVNGTLSQLVQRTAQDNYPPLHNLMLYGSIHLFGDSEWALRLPSAVLGVANVALVFLLGRRLGGPIVGLVAAVLMASSGFHIWYSQEARPYALIGFGATWLAISSLALVDRPGWRMGLAAFLPAVVLIYTHPYAMVCSIAIGVAALAYAAARRQFNRSVLLWLGAAHLAAAIVFLPWAGIMFGRARTLIDDGFWIPPLTWDQLDIAVVVASGCAGLLLTAVSAGLALTLRPTSKQAPGARIFLVLWTALPVGFAIAFSLFVRPLLVSRYLIGIVPAFEVLAALGLASLLVRIAIPLRALLVLAFASVTVSTVLSQPPPREDWRGVATYLNRAASTRDCLVVTPYWYREPLHYYRRGSESCLLPVLAEDIDPSSPQFAGADVFLIGLRCDVRDFAVIEHFEAFGWRASLAAFNGIDVWHLTRQAAPMSAFETGRPPPIARACGVG